MYLYAGQSQGSKDLAWRPAEHTWMRSSRRVQQMQPLVSSTRFCALAGRPASPPRTSSASMFTSAMSFTMTATLHIVNNMLSIMQKQLSMIALLFCQCLLLKLEHQSIYIGQQSPQKARQGLTSRADDYLAVLLIAEYVLQQCCFTSPKKA